MKKSQKGFVSILLIAIIAVLVVFLGIYYFRSSISLFKANQTRDVSLGAVSSASKSSNTLLILVENQLADKLSSEIKTYSSDVKKELGLSTEIKRVTTSDTVLTLKDYVTSYYKTKGLSGVLIVGNVPTGQLYHPDVTDLVYSSQGYILSDSVYQDVLNACVYDSSKNAFSYKDVQCQTGATIQPYWVARLTPNSTTDTPLNQLKSYFKRNHDFRTGKIQFKNNLLVYATVLNGEVDPSSDITTFNNNLAGFGTYLPNHYKIIDQKADNSDIQYLTELSKPYQYEALFLNNHGLPTFHEKNIVSVGILSQYAGKDTLPPSLATTSFVYANLVSCSVGRFTTPDYLAGEYLFRGGLIELAASVPVFGSYAFNKEEYQMLSKGVPFYKAFEFSGVGVNILGDPTLKMRYGIQSNSGAKIAVSASDISFTNLDKNKTLTVKNNGTATLHFTVRGKFLKQVNGQFLTNFSSSLSMLPDSNGVNSILPKKQTTISFDSTYIFPDTLPVGQYEAKYFIVSDDSQHSLTEVNLHYKKLAGATSTSTPPCLNGAGPLLPGQKYCGTTASQPTITVTYPQAGNVIDNRGKTIIANIQWTSSASTNSPVDIDLINTSGGVAKNIAQSVSNTGSYSWSSDPSVVSGTYKIRIAFSKGTYTPFYSGYFSITSSLPSIRVISPNGGELLNFNKGTGATNVQWTSANVSTNNPVGIALVDTNNIVVQTIAQSLSNTGSYVWAGDNTIPNGQYKISVYFEKGELVQDYSDSYFTIQNY